MADLVTVVNAMFAKKQQWPSLTDADKEAAFFMVNRNMSKKYPAQAQFFNKKGINRAAAMDIWFLQMRNQLSVPYWFWAGKKTPKKNADLRDYDLYLQRLKIKYDMTDEEVHTIQSMHADWLVDEIQYLKHIDNANETATTKRRKR